MLVDTHAHLDFPEMAQDLRSVLGRAEANGIGQIITIGISLASSKSAIALAADHANVFATVGIHPHGAFDLDEENCATIRTLARREKVAAIGEIGLDYYRDRQPRQIQRTCLRRQLEIASELRLPVVFHVRDAYDDFLQIVQEYTDSLVGGVMHCFSGTWETAEKCLDFGFYLSIPGTVTYPKAQIQQEVAMRAPLDRLLVETDAPFLAPVPHRGKVNEPSFVLHTAQKIAQLRRCGLEEVAGQTSRNAQRVFLLPAV
ncbi:MAG: TatD family hydrolase [Desulforhabdus sp.]|jgi:TatD DNase family protein|nr:TatD family hydrolase [Desulforhabdus sp.]